MAGSQETSTGGAWRGDTRWSFSAARGIRRHRTPICCGGLDNLGGLICHDDTNQEIDSSPAVGAFLPDGATGIVVGTGSYWKGASDTAKLMAYADNCHQAWSDTLDGATSSSPALADIFGTSHLFAVEGTDDGSGGSVWVIDAATSKVLWSKEVAGRVIGSVVTADLSGNGYQDLLVPTVSGVEVIPPRPAALRCAAAAADGR